jgi:hypothetical protein
MSSYCVYSKETFNKDEFILAFSKFIDEYYHKRIVDILLEEEYTL